jgi:hypothetical protein
LEDLPFEVAPSLRAAVENEVARVDIWSDEFPYYHDGSWSSVSLRGWKPDDPTYDTKPSEMSKAWWAKHPEAKDLKECGWTVFADKNPALVALCESVGWWRSFERIRLLKMEGSVAKPGRLHRHTDITDRSAGTRDGQVVRFHLPIFTHSGATTSAWDVGGCQHVRHLEAWRLYYLDQRKPHAVTNASPVARIHLVVDVISDQTVRDRIATSYRP